MTRSRAAVVLAVFLAAPAAAEGRLGSFEKGLGSKSSSSSSSSGSGECEPWLLCLFMQTLPEGLSASSAYAAERPRGSPSLPVLRLDAGYQRMVGRIDAISGRAELGYSWLACSYERLEMREHDPAETLSSDAAELILRTFAGEGVRLDWAAGYRAYTRGERHNGSQAGLSLGVYMTRMAGLEADLRWGSIADSTIADYRVRWSVRPRGAPGLALTAGYRVLRAGDATLHGPEGGLMWAW